MLGRVCNTQILDLNPLFPHPDAFSFDHKQVAACDFLCAANGVKQFAVEITKPPINSLNDKGQRRGWGERRSWLV